MVFESTFPLSRVCYSGRVRRREAEREIAALQDPWEPAGVAKERSYVASRRQGSSKARD